MSIDKTYLNDIQCVTVGTFFQEITHNNLVRWAFHLAAVGRIARWCKQQYKCFVCLCGRYV